MKTFEQCQQVVAEKRGFDSFENALELYGRRTTAGMYREAAELYATEVAKAQREACHKNVVVYPYPIQVNGSSWNKNSILSTPLVTDKK